MARSDALRPHPPSGRRVRHLQRSRVLAKLGEIVNHRLCLVCAPAGAGKTTTLLDFVDTTEIATAWYQVERSGKDPAMIVRGLLRQLGSDEPVEPRDDLLSGWPIQSALPTLLHALKQRADAGGGRLILILEDYHRAAGSEALNELISGLLDLIPPGTHLVISSRSVPALPLARMRLQGELLLITQEDLALDAEEVSTFLSTSGMKMSVEEEKLVLQKTGGWIAGVSMLLQGLQRRGKGEIVAFLQEFDGSSSVIYDYFAEEVFRQQDLEMQRFLMSTSVLSQLHRDLVDPLLNITDSQATLESLASENAFVISLDDTRDWYRYHPLFRQFLWARAQRNLSQDSLRELHRGAARIYESRGQLIQAIEHYSSAGEHDSAAAIVERVGEAYLERGYLETVGQWLASLPEPVRQTRPTLLMIAGIVAQRSGRYQEADRALSQAQSRFAEIGDMGRIGSVASERAMVFYRIGKYREAVDLLEYALAAVSEAPRRAQTMNRLCTNYMELGELERAMDFGEAALQTLATSAEIAPGPESRSLRYLAETYMLRGDLDRALALLLRAHDLCSREGFGDLEKAYVATGLAVVRAVRGEATVALRGLEEAEEHGARFVEPQRLQLQLWRGNVLTDMGDFDGAEACYQMAGFPPTEMAWLNVRRHQAGRAILLARKALEGAANDRPLRRGAMTVVLGLALGASDQERKGLAALEEAAELFETHGYAHHLASLRLHAAGLLIRLNQPSAGMKMLRETLRIAESYDFLHFYWWDPAMLAWLLGLAVGDEQVRHYAERLVERHTSSADQTALSSLAGLREQARETHNAPSAVAPEPLPEQLAVTLTSCTDPAVRTHIDGWIATDPVVGKCVLKLRSNFGFTWREIEVFVAYYLDRRFRLGEGRGPIRKELADELCMTENTLKTHVKRIRRKLDLPENADSLHVYRLVAEW